jgi:hypothetical protein
MAACTNESGGNRVAVLSAEAGASMPTSDSSADTGADAGLLCSTKTTPPDCDCDWNTALTQFADCDGNGDPAASFTDCGDYLVVTTWYIEWTTSYYYDRTGKFIGAYTLDWSRGDGYHRTCESYDPSFTGPPPTPASGTCHSVEGICPADASAD